MPKNSKSPKGLEKMSISVATKPDPAFKLSTRVIAGRFADQDLDKLRGGYYTPAPLARWLASWAVQKATDRILEPSCGDGAFVDAAALRLMELGASIGDTVQQVQGVEIVPTEAEKARTRLRASLGLPGNQVVKTADFFNWLELDDGGYDCVVGNPPFIRYQAFPEPSRSQAMDLMVREGLKANKLTNIWVPFVVAAASKLRKGGRMALVLPAELLQVTYAAQLRSFLTERFSRIDVIACNELFFDRAEQEVVLLLADGCRKATTAKCRVALTEAATVREITTHKPKEILSKTLPKSVEHSNEKWLKYFLQPKEIEFMREVRTNGVAAPLKEHGSIDVGVVTGKNEFFVLNDEQVKEWGLEKLTVPLVSRAVQMKGASINKDEWEGLVKNGDRVHLLYLNETLANSIPARALRYILEGENQGFQTGYKCSIRSPWYNVPSVWIPDGFFFRQIYDFPRVVLNNANATSTDTIHRLRADQPEKVVSNIYTHLTAASAEIEGRSYGGGVLELEPTEAERMLMPATLKAAMPLKEVDRLVRAGRLDDVLFENDRLVLEALGLNKADCVMLRSIWTKMRDRRLARRRRSKPGRDI
ncbi:MULTISPECIES: class I SAM-dependent methyltransferase [unclassified Novosphingobium]|uniref:Eco57I restriction-modification methylase domain-containing protein n=1 Tax=unclassified Novosphingobium TaxID=2644732 RepID=UPI00190FB34A|nr:MULTISPECIES: class I SAM-dependent methyltransferase [unclassified Novosphingobium]